MLKIRFHNLIRMIVLSTLISACSAISGLNSTGEDTILKQTYCLFKSAARN